MSGHSVIVAIRATTGRFSLSTTGRAAMPRKVRGWTGTRAASLASQRREPSRNPAARRRSGRRGLAGGGTAAILRAHFEPSGMDSSPLPDFRARLLARYVSTHASVSAAAAADGLARRKAFLER